MTAALLTAMLRLTARLAPILFLAIVLLFFGALSERFLTLENLLAILSQASWLVTAAVVQVAVAVALIGFIYWIIGNTAENLRRANIASGFGFLSGRAGFDLSQSLISYSSNSSFMRAITVGILNTLVVAPGTLAPA